MARCFADLGKIPGKSPGKTLRRSPGKSPEKVLRNNPGKIPGKMALFLSATVVTHTVV
jgi:hypothetical protein